MMVSVAPNAPCMDTGKPPARLPDVPKLEVKELGSAADRSFWDKPSPELCASQTAVTFNESGIEILANWPGV